MDAWLQELTLPASPDSVREARDFVVARLLEVGLPGMVDDARLVTTELSANAVHHAQTPFTLTLRWFADGLILSVRDESPHEPIAGGLGSQSDHGRGLLLVAGLSADWGVAMDKGGGKAVWARLDGNGG
jgi:anti-sigma regulatory factor (Ser/Thr protein kinase)